MFGILLETRRLILRQFSYADADNLYQLDNDPLVMRYINGGTPTPYSIIQKDILPTFLQYEDQQPGYGFWAITQKPSGKFLGWISLRLMDDNPVKATLGYRLCREAWGHGYATEAVHAVLHKGFSELGMQRVVATTYEDNIASRRVMEKAGMRLTRMFRITQDDLLNTDTHHVTDVEMWDGYDVEYVLEKDSWFNLED